MHDNNQKILRGILEDSEAHPNRSETDQKIGGFYQSCMDEAALNTLGRQPLQPELDEISRIHDRASLLSAVVQLHQYQSSVLFSFNSAPDPNNARQTIADLDQGGLGLPEKDFYLRADARSVEIRAKYVEHIAKMFQLLGVDPVMAAKKASLVMEIETALAKVSLDVTSRRDPQNVLHITSVENLTQISPGFDFPAFFKGVGAPPFKSLNVDVPAFIKGLSVGAECARAAGLERLFDVAPGSFLSRLPVKTISGREL